MFLNLEEVMVFKSKCLVGLGSGLKRLINLIYKKFTLKNFI
jgi:hypothetical protein